MECLATDEIVKIPISLEELIYKGLDNTLDFNKIITKYFLTDDIINYFADKWNWTNLVINQTISNNVIRLNKDKFDIFTWQNICRYQKLTEDDINRYKYKFDIVCWDNISRYQYKNISEEFIENNINNINMIILCFKFFSEDFLNKHFNLFDCFDIKNICKYQNISEKFIEKHKYKLRESDWVTITCYQFLSEEFIEKYYNYFNVMAINNVFGFQHISLQFIENHINDIDRANYNIIL